MSVTKVCVVSIIGRETALDDVVEECERSHIFHPDNALSFFSDTNGFSALNEPNPYAPLLQRLRDTVSLSGKALPLNEKSSVKMEKEEIAEYVEWFANAFSAMQHEKQELLTQKEGYAQDIEQLGHFVGLNINIDEVFRCQYIKVRFGRLPKESFEKLKSYNDNPYVLFFPCTNTAEYYWGVYFCPIESVAEVDRIFSSLYFERLRIPGSAATPEHAVEQLRELGQQAEEHLRSLDARIDAFWEQEHQKAAYAYKELDRYSLLSETKKYAAKYSDNFILTGWVPEVKKKKLLSRLDKIPSVEYTVEAADEELGHSPPVALKNPRIFKPFEFFVDMYGLPSYDEVDPTPLVAITYTLLFGIMFGDLGQGLVLSVIGWLMWKLKKMKLGKVLIPCGISSAFFGLVFGSVFGYENALNPLYHALFGVEEKPIEVMQPQTTNMIIYGAVGVGVLLVIIAMLINIYSSFRRKHVGEAIFGPNGITGLVFYVSLILGLVGQMLLNISLMTPLYVILLIVLPLLILYVREPLIKLVDKDPDWKPKKWGEFFMQIFFELFECVLSYATNTMSFLRVGAFVLVHAGMMQVVFTLAQMSSGVGNILIVAIGNGVVMCMEGLLVGIQVLRLEFYELFSRFFGGEGRPFKPLAETVPEVLK